MILLRIKLINSDMNIQMLIPEFKTIPYEEIKFGNDFPITVFDDLVIDF